MSPGGEWDIVLNPFKWFVENHIENVGIGVSIDFTFITGGGTRDQNQGQYGFNYQWSFKEGGKGYWYSTPPDETSFGYSVGFTASVNVCYGTGDWSWAGLFEEFGASGPAIIGPFGAAITYFQSPLDMDNPSTRVRGFSFGLSVGPAGAYYTVTNYWPMR
jgi:hypothetical protein